MSTITMNDVGAIDSTEPRDEVEITLFWGNPEGGSALATKHVAVGRSVRVGEDGACDLTVPADAIGASSHELVSFRGGEAVVTAPPGALVLVSGAVRSPEPFVLAHGHTCEVRMGAFCVRVSISAAERPIPAAIAASLEQSAFGSVGFSAVTHAAFLAAFAFFMPALGQADQESYDRDQMLSMKAFIDAAAERELDTPPPVEAVSHDLANSGSNAGQRAQGAEGAMGSTRPVTTAGRWSAKGDNRPEDARLARDRALSEAADFGMIGLLNAAQASDPNAPVVPWGEVLAGADRESHMGNLWGNDIGDALGTGLGLSGNEQGGGGKGQGIGINGVGNYGHAGTCPLGADCTGGFGNGHPPLARGHVATGPTMRQPKEISTNGRLDPEVIRRIVRLNSGRMVGCYQTGLRTNPALSGRVAVAFAIDREGSVSTVRDAGSDLADPAVTQCVIKSFYSLSFPPPAGGIVTVTYPLTFSPAQ